MKPFRLLFGVLIPFLAFGQSTNPAAPTLMLTGPTSAIPGSVITLSVTTSGFPNNNISVFGFTIQMPSGYFLQTDSWSTASGIVALGDTIIGGPPFSAGCAALNDVSNCGLNSFLVAGLGNGTVSNNPVTQDGVVGTFPVAIPATATGTLTFSILNTPADDINGNLVVVNPGATPQSITVQITAQNQIGKCDVNGDGLVNFADADAVAIAAVPPSTTCPIAGTAGACTLQQLVYVIRAAMGAGCAIQ